jgi:hypothetical protein
VHQHELCHTIDAALSKLDLTWRGRLRQTYQSALGKGLWKNTYAASNATGPAFEQRREKQQHELRVRRIDIGFDSLLKALYGEQRLEKWVGGVEAYFDTQRPGSHAKLKATAPPLFALIVETFAYTNPLSSPDK